MSPPLRTSPRRRLETSRMRHLRLEMLEDRRLLAALPDGDEFRVNLVATGVQRLGIGSDAVGEAADGGAVVIYTGTGTNKTAEIFGQRFAASGAPLGGQFGVNQFVSGNQDVASLAVRADGSFVTVWAGKGAGDSAGVFFRRFAADGTPLGGDQRANATTKEGQAQPSIAAAADGRFAIAWAGRGAGDSSGVFLRWFDADGTPLTGEVRVNTTTASTQSQPDVSVAAHGSYAVAWSGKGNGDSSGVFLQRFAAEGTRLGGETRVNQTTKNTQQLADVLAEAGGVVTVWSGAGAGDSAGVYWRRMDTSGEFSGGEVRVNTATLGAQQSPALAAVGDGSYFVVWGGQRFERGRFRSWDVLSQQLDASGERLLPEQAINVATQGLQYSPSVTGNGQGQIVAAWSGKGPGDSAGVFGRRFAANFDTTPPALTASLANDTGASNTDGVTSDPTIAGQAVNASGVAKLEAALDSTAGPLTDISDLLQAAGQFAISAARLDALAGGALATGPHTLRLRATDQHGNAAENTIAFTLQSDGIFIASLDLSAASDSGTVGDQKTNAGRVVLTGQTEPLAMLKLLETGAEALANSAGLFQFPSVELAIGLNTLTFEAQNALGQTAQRSITIERTSEAAVFDPVLRWNQAALDAARLDSATPPFASRAYAMVHAAIYDAVAAIDGAPSYLVTLPASAGASLEAAIAAAGERVLSYLYAAQQDAFGTILAEGLALVPDGAAESDGMALGRAIADAVIAIRTGDGWDDYVPTDSGDEPGEWQFTPPMHDPALLPQWATLDPFALTSPDQFRPAGPPALTSQTWANAYDEVRSLGAFDSTIRTGEQTQIARFWADGPGTFCPPGHWNQIARQFAVSAGNSVAENARLFAMLNIAQADAAIASWDAKYTFNLWRPVTAIRAGDTDSNDLTVADEDWQPLLVTPPFPEYTSGHSTFSGAGAAILTAVFGDNQSFSTTSQSLLGVTRTFSSFSAAALEASKSRVYGGIHYAFSGADGLTTGEAVASQVLARFSAASDQTPPQIVIEQPAIGLVTATNFTLAGRVLDNLSGVASLEAQLDGSAFAPVAFDSNGQFSIPTQLSLSGLADGEHAFHLRATDAAGSVAPNIEFAFTLDTRVPLLTLDTPTAGGSVASGSLLTGTLSGTGTALTQFHYSLDGGTPIPLPLPAREQFSSPLDLSRLNVGQHTLVVTARDSAGLTSTVSRTIQLAAAIPLTLLEHTPLDGASEVGSTFKPQIVFSRPIDPATLSAANFYATTPAGEKVPAKIVPASDGTFAWLFFNDPLPGGAQITVHVDGSTILPAGGGAALDADGAAGGTFDFTFTTVSLTPLVGTTLSGRVFDPGPDLKPMTFDEFRAGPDGALFTTDDVFLLPIANAKVFIVGLEEQPVFTDAQGTFHFDAAPAGNVKLAIDGRTATNAPAGVFFPEMVMDQFLEAGRANTVLGTMGSLEDRVANRERTEVYLPRIETSILHTVSGNQPMTIGVDAESAPNLSPQQRAQLSIQVQPGTLLDQNGNPVATGQIGISTVPPELVREMLPPGLLQHTFDITVQAPGVTNFATPAPITFPNTFNAPPGTQLNLLSFDHTTGRLEIEGTMTVSADGLSVHTDPGTGITHPGWHGLTAAGGPGGPRRCEVPPQTTVAAAIAAAPAAAPAAPTAAPTAPAINPVLSHVGDFLFTGLDRFELMTFKNDAPRINPNQETCSPVNAQAPRMHVSLQVLPFSESTGGPEDLLVGLTSQEFDLLPGESKDILFGVKPVDVARREFDVLRGARFHLVISQITASGAKTIVVPGKVYYIYQYVDVADADESDGKLEFFDILNDGADGDRVQRQVMYEGDRAALPTLRAVSPSGDFLAANELAPAAGEAPFRLFFDPRASTNLQAPLQITTPAPTPRTVAGPGALQLAGKGVDGLTVRANLQGLAATLEELAADNGAQDVTIKYAIDPRLPNPSARFNLTLGSETTSEMPIGASALDMQAAVTSLNGVGSVSVSSHDLLERDELGRLIVIRTYSIHFDFPPTSGRRPLFLISDPVGGSYLDANATFHVGPGLTANERELIVTPALRTALAQDVFEALRERYRGFDDTKHLEIRPDAGGSDFNFLWGTSPNRGVLGETTIPEYTVDLDKIAKSRAVDSKARQDFRLTRAMNAKVVRGHAIRIYVDNHFESKLLIPYDASRAELVNFLAETAAHELGHGLGLVHTAGSRVKPPQIYEIQNIVLQGGNASDTFALSFGGDEITGLSRTISAANLGVALRRLPGIDQSDLVVTGPSGGPYSVNFVNPSLPESQPSFFRGVNVPQINGLGTGSLQVHISTTKQGSTTVGVADEIVVAGSRGRFDLMASGAKGPLTFLPHLSQSGLRIALRTGTTPELRAYESVILQASQNGFRLEPDETGDQTDGGELATVLGRQLAPFDSEGFLGPQAIEFAVAPPGQLSTRVLTLKNVGGEVVLIHSIRVTRGLDRFSVAAIPETRLAAGETLEFEVSYSALAGVASTGVLAIDTDAEGFDGAFDLAGAGQQADEPDILAQFPFNNLGGIEVGQSIALSGINALRGYGSLPIVFNNGPRPLTITEIRAAAGRGQEEYSVNLPLPAVVQPGESLEFDPIFRPSGPGLRPGVLEIVSDDPQSPLVRLPLVGTGVQSAGASFVNQNVGSDFVAVGSSLFDDTPVLRTKSDAGGNWEFFLPPESWVQTVTFDPVSGLIAHGGGQTAASGQRTEFNIGVFAASADADTDGDGLPDDVEFVIGTSDTRIDTDGDGASDFAELASGQNPSDNRPTISGIVAGLATPGQSLDVELAVEASGAGRPLAFLAAGDAGLMIVDVTRPDQPLLVSQLDLPGVAVDVDVDVARGIAAVAAGAAGLHLIDISDAARPQLLTSAPFITSCAELFDGLVYACGSDGVAAFDAVTGEFVENLSLGGPVSGLRRDGTLLYATVSGFPNRFQAIDLSGPEMLPRGALNLPDPAQSLFVADGVAWLGLPTGLMTVEVSDPDNLRLLNLNTNLQRVSGVALDGSGLGVIVAPGAVIRESLLVVQTNDPSAPLPTVTQFTLPALGQAVAIFSGLAYVAAGSAGLQVINLSSATGETTLADLTLRVLNADIDPDPGWQLPQASTVTLAADIAGDFRVRNVELLVDGRVVRNAVSFPFDLTTTLPLMPQNGTEVVFQARATDTEGNVVLSNRVLIEPALDLTAPTILQLDPPEGSTRPSDIRNVRVRFSEALDPATLTPANFELIGPAGPVSPSVFRLRQQATLLDLRYAPLSPGDYQIVIHAAGVTDRVGNPLGNSDVVSTFHVASPPPMPVAAEILAGRHTLVFNRETVGQLQAVADFNRDGHLDVVIPGGTLHGRPEFSLLQVMLGQGDGTFQLSAGSPTGAAHVIAADFNNDGLLDLAGVGGGSDPFGDTLLVALGNGDGTFQAAIETLVPRSSLFLVAGDFNRDGNLDLGMGMGLFESLAVVPDVHSIRLLYGNGNGTFTFSADASRAISGLGSRNEVLRFAGLAARDMDGDGNVDIVAADPFNGALHVFRGQPDGVFPRDPANSGRMIVVTTPLPAGAKFLAIADYNADGRLDVAATGVNEVFVLLGNGDATFQPPAVYAAPGALDIVAADYNRDGRLDLVVNNLGNTAQELPTPQPDDYRGSIHVLINQGNGGFAPARTFLAVASPQHIAAGDFNGDGNTDLFATAFQYGASVVFGDGAGGLNAAQRYPSGRVDYAISGTHAIDVVRAADLNNDGASDVIFSDRRGAVFVQLGNGDRTFQPVISHLPVSHGQVTFDIEIGDINHDGNLDLALLNYAFTSVDILLGNGDGTFGPRNSIVMPTTPPFIFERPPPGDVALADLNQDGDQDLIVAFSGFANHLLLVMLGDGNGSFSHVFPDPQNPGERYHRFAPVAIGSQINVADFNGDGILDVAALVGKDTFSQSPSEMRILFVFPKDPSDPNNVRFALGPPISAPPRTYSFTAADVTGDGVLDLIAGSQSLGLFAPEFSDASISVYEGLVGGNFAPPRQYGFGYPYAYFGIIAADVNADGHRDLVASTASTDSLHIPQDTHPTKGVAVLLNQGDGTFGAPAFYDHSGKITGGVAAADFNSDGLNDILVANRDDDSFSILFAAPAGAPLRAAAGLAIADASRDATTAPLTTEQLPAVVDAAILRWASAGLNDLELDTVRRARWRIADLPGDLLGLAAEGTITLDSDAAGFGWFIDPTPSDDAEFEELFTADSLSSTTSGEIADRMDLLTVVMHELGHLLGLDHTEDPDSSDFLMSRALFARRRSVRTR